MSFVLKLFLRLLFVFKKRVKILVEDVVIVKYGHFFTKLACIQSVTHNLIKTLTLQTGFIMIKGLDGFKPILRDGKFFPTCENLLHQLFFPLLDHPMGGDFQKLLSFRVHVSLPQLFKIFSF